MKEIVSVIFVLFFTMNTFSQDINGVWEETSTPDHQNSTVVICQLGNQVYLTCYWEFKGKPVVWKGECTRKGNQLEFGTKHAKIIKGWDPNVRQHLTISDNGKSMSGKWQNSNGDSGKLSYVKKSKY
jgi:hypothetical protein